MMAEQDVLASTPQAPSRPGRAPGPGLLGAARELSERTPLRTKLITAVLVLVIMAILAISIASVYMLRSYVETRQDSTLQNVFAPFANQPTHADGSANLPQTLGGRSGGYQLMQPGYAYSSNTEAIFALAKPGGQVAWSPVFKPGGGISVPQLPLPQLPTSTGWANPPNGALITVPAQSGPDSWRIIAETQSYPVEGPDGTQTDQKFTFVAAIDLGDLGAMTNRLVLFDLIVGGAIVVVLAAVAIGVVRTNLRPLDDIELTAGQIAAGHLDHRVPEGDPRTEVGSLGRSLNAMLAQIETAFHAQQQSEQAAHESEERMRRFIADASHELRTPLTTIRGFAAHYRQRGGAVPASQDGLSGEDLDHLMSRVESEATRMGLLVEDLLTLARLDQQRPVTKAPVDLLSLAADAVQDARIVSPGRPIDLVVAPGTAFLVDGDEPRLRQVLGNLVNNAITHTPDGTPVRVKIAAGTSPAHLDDAGDRPERGEPGIWAVEDGAAPAPAPGADGATVPAVVLDVEDDGPGMTAEQAHRVFERFYRADAARNRASGGTGLGLAIVAGLVAAHGGTVSVRTRPGQGADFQVKLPLSPDALVADDADEDSDAGDDLAG